MTITINGLPIGSGTPGPNSVGSLEIIDNSVGSVDITDGTITPADLAFNPFLTGPRTPLVLSTSAPVDPLVNDLILLDTTVSAVVATLPAAPADGLSIEVLWLTGALSASVSGNGNNIMGVPSLTLDELKHSYALTYISTLGEWVLTT